MKYKAQGAIEYLLIIGAAILVVAIVILAVTGVLGGGKDQTAVGQESVTTSFDSLRESSTNFVRLSNNYYTKSDPLTSSLSALWRFDKLPDNNTFSDSSGNGNDGTCTGTTCPSIVAGLWGNALEFSYTGANNEILDSILVSSKTIVPRTESYSVSAWVKYPCVCTNSAYCCVDKIVGTNAVNGSYVNDEGWSFGIYRNANGETNVTRFAYLISDGSCSTNCQRTSDCTNDCTGSIYANPQGRCSCGVDVQYEPQVLFSPDTFHNFVEVYDRQNLKVCTYIDGQISGACTTLNANQISINVDLAKYDLTIGGFTYGTSARVPFVIQEVAVWSRAISATEVKQLYDNALNAGK
ncbi:MAG: hypothetical protein AABX51_08395 [Nanoarchaeota archaeon]